MAVVGRIATIVMSGATGSRTLIATATATAAPSGDTDTAAGSSVVVTVTQSTTGASPPGVPDTLTLEYRTDAAVLIKSVALTAGSASQTNTFFFTSNGLTGAANRADTVEIVLRATKTTGGVGATYDVETDGAPNTPPTGFTTTQLDRGWIRATVVANYLISNVGLAGIQSEPAEYDESLFVVIQSTTLYIARALTVGLNAGSLSGNTNNTTSSSHTLTFANVVDDRFPAAVTNTFVNSVTVPNATLTGLPAFVISSTVTVEDIDVDWRFSVKAAGGALGWHFQLNQASFDTSYYDSSKQMQPSDVGQAAVRLVKARTGNGQNGIVVDLTADPTNPGTTVTLASQTTVTLDGEDGWTPLIEICPNGKPAGTWTLNVTVTTADANLAGGVVNPTDTVSVTAQNPNVTILAGGGNLASGEAGNHFTAGNSFVVAGAVRNAITRQYVTPDASPAPTVVLMRLNTALGRGEYLRASDLTWVAAASATADAFTMTASPGDANVFLKTFTAAETTNWGMYDIVADALFYVNATPYVGHGTIEALSDETKHTDVPSGGSSSADHAGAGISFYMRDQRAQRAERRKKLEEVQARLMELRTEARAKLQTLKTEVAKQAESGEAVTVDWQAYIRELETVIELQDLKMLAEEEEFVTLLLTI